MSATTTLVLLAAVAYTAAAARRAPLPVPLVLMLVALAAERNELYTLRDRRTINDATLREIETRLDRIEMAALGVARARH